MLLARTLTQLDIGPLPETQARELAELGFVQWLDALPGDSDYRVEAMRAYAAAEASARRSTAIAIFRDMLVASSASPPAPLAVSAGPPRRRGGARSRRAII